MLGNVRRAGSRSSLVWTTSWTRNADDVATPRFWAEAWVWMARPEGPERAVQTLEIEGVVELIEALRAA